MTSKPTWEESLAPPDFEKPAGRIQVDALVIGGGITGVTTASLLKQAGCKVALVDLHRIGGGETAHTTAHVTCVTDTRLAELVSSLGKAEAQALWDAGDRAMQQIEAMAAEYAIECELRRVPGYLFAAEGKELDAERKSLKQDAGLAAEMGFDANYIESAPLFQRPAVRFANQLKFHPLKYLFGLARTLPGDGCHVFEGTDGTRLDEKKRQLRMPGGAIAYDALIVATHVPLQGHRGALAAALFQTKLAAYSTYAIEARVDAMHEALFWDTNDPYLYLRIDKHPRGTRVILGGEDHKTGQEPDTEARYAKLGQTLRKIFPEAEPERRWSGQVIETPDGLPYIGEAGERQFLATGFSGNGMTLGTFSAMLIADLVAGRKNAWTELFDPHRKRLAGTWEYLRENKDFPACFIKDHLSPVHESISDLSPGEAGLVKVDGKKYAVHMDANGECTALSPVCPHMGCIVGWNAAEKTWDCPCHGSRFTATGDLIAGPAEKGLEKVDVAAAAN
jgi:glycine/D-amino acid oxidase-like deaminating enzyme/nitrite reductase/ring-hydroxylating ferredoxin subunit